MGQGPVLHAPGPVPSSYRRAFPLYFAGDVVHYEVELENTGALPLRDLTLRSRQERFDPQGRAGRPLGSARWRRDVAFLATGGRAVVRGSFSLSPGGRTLNFEQTHLTLVGARSTGSEVLLDAPQAGIVDPPR